VRGLLAAAGLLALAGLGGTAAFYLAFLRDLPDLDSLDDYRPPLASHVYDRHGVPIGEFYTERRVPVPFAEIPRHVVHAFVAGEDSSFFQHQGIDFTSILRAAWVNLRAGGEIVQGGSTITQQMVKSLLLTPERSYRRKLREMILARDIERRFTKEEILYLYLNQIYFGHGAHGIGEAARTYFGKDVRELRVSEAALLAGLPKAPSRYSPHAKPDQAERRRRYVLDRMLEDGFIDARTHAEAVQEVPVLAELPPPAYADAAFFTEEVRRYLFEKLGGDAVLQGGLEIETTLDASLQRAAVAAVRRGLEALDRRQGYRGSERRVADAELAAELERLARENGFAPAQPGEAGRDAGPGEGGGAAPARPAYGELAGRPAAGRARASPALPADRTLRGVVTGVDEASQTARVAFAPGIEAQVALEEVAWARPGDSAKGAPTTVRSIARVLRRGDVARFRALPAPAADASGPPRVALFQEPLVEGALLSLEVGSGEVLALVGGYDYARSQFDRVTQARRQPGSSFKPIIYGAALAKGYTPASIVWDRPVVYTDETSGFTWRPRNYGRAFFGPITLREALARSVNNATVHLFRDVGVDYVIRYARRLGIESPLSRDLSLALGSSTLSLLELTRAYAVFAAGGRRVVPVFIRRVRDRDGNPLLERVELGALPAAASGNGHGDGEGEAPREAGGEEAAPPEPELEALPASFEADPDPNQLLPPAQAYLVTDLLRAVVNDPHATGWRLRALERPLAGKTGTTNDQADAWFLGFSPDIATGVWVGHDETRFLGWGETGGRAASPIWVEFMRVALQDRPARDFPVPEQIVFARIDRKTGLLADESSSDAVFQSFLAESEPTETAGEAQDSSEDRRLLRMDSF
jgi:penicillin-binding protein 1A